MRDDKYNARVLVRTVLKSTSLQSMPRIVSNLLNELLLALYLGVVESPRAHMLMTSHDVMIRYSSERRRA